MATFLQTSGSISMSQINAVFGRGNNLNAYRGTTYYTATTGPNTFPSTSSAISFNNFYGTGPDSNTAVVNINALAGTWISYYSIILPNTIDLLFANDGVLQMFSDNTENLLFNGGAASTWATPTGSGVGNNFWIKWTLVGTVGTNGSATGSSAGRLALSTTRTLAVYKSSGGTTDYTAEYDFEIWDAASGGTQVGSALGVTMIASRATGP